MLKKITTDTGQEAGYNLEKFHIWSQGWHAAEKGQLAPVLEAAVS